MKSVLAFLSATLFSSAVFAQTDIDALRYSSIMFNGSARSTGLGGAITGLGGDISSLSVNPAGIAKIGKSEFTITPGLDFVNSNATIFGSTLKDNQMIFGLNNAGFVYAPKKKVKSLNGFSIGFSYNRLATFNDNFYLKGENTENSLTYNYADQLNGAGVDSLEAKEIFPFQGSLAYLGEIIRRTPENEYLSMVNTPVDQRMIMNRKGNMGDLSFGVGIVTKRNLMLGVSLGIPIINYSESYFFKETDSNDVSPDFNYWQREDLLNTEGAGINAKFGIIYAPISSLRIGAAFTTPTRFSLTDNYTTYFESDFTQFKINNYETPAQGAFEYKLTTPWRFNAGASFIQNKWGLISLEYELTDPANAKFRFKENDSDLRDYENDLNNGIENKYKKVHTIKAGIEGKIKDFRVRGGIQYRSSPFQNQAVFDDLSKNTLVTYSGGMGYRGKKFFIDGVYYQSVQTEVFVPYESNYGTSPVGVVKHKRPGFSMTLGFKF